MPVLSNATNVVAALIPLDLIRESTNVRVEYNEEDIASLAASIEQYGQLQPVGVKPADSEGFFELIFGYRRHRAFELLVKQGKPFLQMKAVFVGGNTLTLQLVENIQRANLSTQEKERALQEMAETMTHAEIARALNKSKQWVSDLFAGVKVREDAAAIGADTEGMATKALAQARSIPREALRGVIKEAQKNGGSVMATRQAVEDYRARPLVNEPDAEEEPSLGGNPEDDYDFARRKSVDLGEVISEIVNYRCGWKNFVRSQKANSVFHACNKIIEILVRHFGG